MRPDDETRKSFGITGPRLIESIKLSLQLKTLNGTHPREQAELPEERRAVVAQLAAKPANGHHGALTKPLKPRRQGSILLIILGASANTYCHRPAARLPDCRSRRGALRSEDK